MFTEEELKKVRNQEEQWKEQIRAMGGGGSPQKSFSTASGINLKPVYGPADIAHLDIGSLGFPGQYPFTRGNYPVHYQAMPLAMTQGYGMETPEETRKRTDKVFLALNLSAIRPPR